MAVTTAHSQMDKVEGSLESQAAIPLPQLIPVENTAVKGLALAAGSHEAQEKFLYLMELTTASIPIQKENIFEIGEAELIATALSHAEMAMGQTPTGDPYFTADQWEVHQQQVEGLVDNLYEMAVAKSGLDETNALATTYRQSKAPRCKCIAHQSELEVVWKLIDIPDRLTDDWGNKLANALLPQIFQCSNLHKMDIEDCKQGSLYAVNYILQLPSGESYQFTCWPDFTITRRYHPYAEQRIMMAYHRRARTQVVGEIQTKDKTKAFAQVGINGVGQLAQGSKKKMAVIIIYKDKSAQVIVAATHLSSIPLQLSLGDVKYQVVGRVDSMSLKDPDELQEFAKILVSTIRWVAPSSS